MQILGLIFAGTATDRREEMTQFATDVLGLTATPVEGAGADMFELPDGSTFAIAGPRELGETSRTLGFLVTNVDEAIAGLRAAGVEVDEPLENARFRYAHFHAPDGHLYELVERSLTYVVGATASASAASASASAASASVSPSTSSAPSASAVSASTAACFLSSFFSCLRARFSRTDCSRASLAIVV